MHNTNDNLSRAASVLWRRFNEATECCQDLAAFHAPSECHDLVFGGWQRETDRQVSACGIDPDQLYDLLAERTSKWTAYTLTAG